MSKTQMVKKVIQLDFEATLLKAIIAHADQATSVDAMLMLPRIQRQLRTAEEKLAKM